MYRDYIQKRKRESKHNTKGSYQLIREQKKMKGKNDLQKTTPKQLTKWQ